MNKEKKESILKAMKENAFCFSSLIPLYLEGGIKDINVLIPLEYHLQSCEICAEEKKAYEEYIGDTPAAGEVNAAEIMSELPSFPLFTQELEQCRGNLRTALEICRGQIWLTPGFPPYLAYKYRLTGHPLPYSLDPRPILISHYDREKGIVNGYPLNLEYRDFCSTHDLAVSERESDTGLAFLVEAWNPVSTGAEFLNTYWGSVSDTIVDSADALHAQLGQTDTSPANKGLEEFQQLEHQISQVISAPLKEKEEWQAKITGWLKEKVLESLIVTSIIYMQRHKDFYPLAGSEDNDRMVSLYKTERYIFNEQFTLMITVNQREAEFLLQMQVMDNISGEETRSFVGDILEWPGTIPEDAEDIKIAWLLHQQNNSPIRHLRLWEKLDRLAVPSNKNIILAIYRAENSSQVEFLPLDMMS